MKATWRKMVGTALLWVALAALIYVPTARGDASSVIIALLGFASFASGLALFANGLKRGILHELRADRSDRPA